MDTRMIESSLAERYHYKKLPPALSELATKTYKENLPSYLNLNGDNSNLYTKNGILICSGYTRIVVGDYGAFIEFSKDQANHREFIIAPGQEYRISDPRYSKNVKYEWYTTNDGSGIKIYLQKKRVVYADYNPGFYYVSPHEVCLIGLDLGKGDFSSES